MGSIVLNLKIVSPSIITKRNGQVVPFDQKKIEKAIYGTFDDISVLPETPIKELTRRVLNIICAKTFEPTVEQVQDTVENVLLASGEYAAAKNFILYREEHRKLRLNPIPEEVEEAFEDSSKYFPTQIQQFQFFDKYSRFNHELGRRETWVETVDRAVNFLIELSQDKLEPTVYERIRKAILEMKVMPSMRLLAMAGPAARRSNICLYNCSYLVVDCIDSIVEALIISMSGCGVGYSVERKYVENFSRIKRQMDKTTDYIIEDSTDGWAEALRFGLEQWFEGKDVKFNYGLIRPAGTVLKIKGGQASGPQPLQYMLDFVRGRLLARQGTFLRSIDAHDIMTAVGGCAISGGMRRTAMISLFDFDDRNMLSCKDGDLEKESQRWNANNSAVIPERGLTQVEFLKFFLGMVESERGEPGIFNRDSINSTIPKRRVKADFGINPCGELPLRPNEFCNLSIAVARKNDTLETLEDKIELATIIGTIQSMATNFPGLREDWRKNAVEERLLGVDITGQMDCPIVQDETVLRELKQVAIDTNKKYARLLGINQSAAITCVKPNGNSGILLDSSSGLHTRWSSYYIRNVRVSAHSPIFKVLKDHNVPMDPENGETRETAKTWVIHFPVKSPEGSITRKDRTAVEQTEYWKKVKLNYTEHNPSCTITYKENEIIDLANWVWQNLDILGGMSFLPESDANYAQMPYIEINKEQYEELNSKFPTIDFSKIWYHEKIDQTEAAQNIACVSGYCEL